MLLTVDFLEFAVKNVSIDDVLHFLNFETVTFCHTGRFNMNYSKSLSLKGFCKIGYDNQKSDYSVYVSLSGSGCRLLEDYGGVSFSWYSFIKDLFNGYDVDFRRIDIAFDDYTDLLNTRKLWNRYYKKGKFAGSCRSVPKYIEGREEELIFGSSQSDYLVRIYNKALERGYKAGEPIFDTNTGEMVDFWWRIEQQMRSYKANQFIMLWVMTEEDKLAEYSCGYLLEFMRFLTKPNDKKNSQRIPVCKWWLDFLGNASRVKFFSKPGSVYNMHKLDKFINKQCASSLKTYIHMFGLSPDELYHHFANDDIMLNGQQLALLRANAEGLYNKLFNDTVFSIPVPDDEEFNLKQFQADFLRSVIQEDNSFNQLTLFKD